MRIFKKVLSTALSAAVVFSFGSIPAFAESTETDKGIVIIHVNDVHCGVNADDSTYGYAELAAYESKLQSEGYTTILVDAGDFCQGDVIGTLSEGEYIVDIMNELDFDVATLGNHEFDYGMEQLTKLTDMADFEVVSSNFLSLETGESVYDGWTIVEADGVKIGFVGITTPESITKSRPTHFQNDDGEYIYGFCAGDNGEELYANVQTSVDAAIEAGADTIVALSHLGTLEASEPYRSVDVIANTTGIDICIDGHSHSVIDNETVLNENGESVVLTSTGTKLQNIGTVSISGDSISAKLIKKGDYEVTDDESSAEYAAYSSASEYISGIEAKNSELVNTVVAKTDVKLTTTDPSDSSVRIIRNSETNLGDLCADAYRAVLGADIGVMNGGGIRADIEQGDITYGDIISVFPYGNMMCVCEATGQEILDLLEMGAAVCPEENGGFQQVSGLTYEIHIYIPSSVVKNELGEFVSVDGEYRVKNVMVNGEPLDLEKTYTVASHNYLIKQGGSGCTMFKDNVLLQDEVMIDNQLLIDYITEYLGGVVGEEYANPLGSGRITICTSASTGDEDNDSSFPTEEPSGSDTESSDNTESVSNPAAESVNTESSADTDSVISEPTAEVEDGKEAPDTGAGSLTIFILAAIISSAVIIAAKRKKTMP